jgi:hypothetical protein
LNWHAIRAKYNYEVNSKLVTELAVDSVQFKKLQHQNEKRKKTQKNPKHVLLNLLDGVWSTSDRAETSPFIRVIQLSKQIQKEKSSKKIAL